MQGLVIRSTGSWYEVQETILQENLSDDLQVDNQQPREVMKCRLKGKFKTKELKITNPIAVGDRVIYEIENESEQTGVITNILPRDNYIIRKSVHKTAHGQLIASNLDQAMIIATLTSPRTSLGFIDRFLVAAESFRIPAVVIFNKTDLLSEEGLEYQQELVEIYEKIGYKCLQTSTTENLNIDKFEFALKDKKTLLSGHSGVGKSSLVNALNPALDIRTAEISTFANKGIHTTTFAQMFEITRNSYIIDTPGIKELGLMDISPAELSHYFPEMRNFLNKCKFNNCLHTHEPKCVVRDAVEAGEIAECRYQSYLSMLENDDDRR